jgi:ribonuclease HII
MVSVIGVDEVGRGCWAGPLVAAAVQLNHPVAGLRDSKRLSIKQRVVLDQVVRDSAQVGLGWVSAEELDKVGLSQAVRLAMTRAIIELGPGTSPIIVDGNINYLSAFPSSEALICADQTVPSVSAASIVAKVARDAYMKAQAVMYPEYGFEQHVGYGTARHREALRQFGLTLLHRKSFRPVREVL